MIIYIYLIVIVFSFFCSILKLNNNSHIFHNLYLKFKKNLSYVEVIEDLAKLQGKTVEYENSAIAEKIQEKKKKQQDLRKYLLAIQKKFKQELFNQPSDSPVWQEINKRGYSKEDVIYWDLGFAPGNQFMYKLFSEVGNVEAGKKLGLLNDKNNDNFTIDNPVIPSTKTY